MTFLELLNLVKQSVWPEKIAANLAVLARYQLQSAMSELQQVVESLQDSNTVVYPQNATLWKCGATKFAIPGLKIVTECEVIQNDLACCAIKAVQTTKDLMQCRTATCADDLKTPLTLIADGEYAPDDTIDHRVPPIQYFAALWDNTLWVYPYISSINSIRVTFKGLKRSWLDADLIPAGWMAGSSIDPDLFNYLVAAMTLHRRDVQCDSGKMVNAQRAKREILFGIMHDEARIEANRLKLPPRCISCCSSGFATGWASDTVSRGSRLGDSYYLHPISRRRYLYLSGLYYEITVVEIDGIVQESVSTIGVADPQ